MKDLQKIDEIDVIKKVSLLPAVFFCLIQLCTVVDNVGLMNSSSAITATFHSSVADIQIANVMFSLMAGSIMIAAGFLGRMIGWKRLMQIGLLVLAVGELMCVLSPNITVFVYCARVLVGIGASLAVPAVLGLITSMYQKKQQAAVFGLVAASIAIGASIFPLITGLIIVYINWQFIYIILTILFTINLFYISFCIAADKVEKKKKTFDLVGFILIFLSLSMLIMGLSKIIKWGFIEPDTPPFLVFGYSPAVFVLGAGIISLFLFILWGFKREKKKGVESVLIPRVFLTNRQTRSSLSMNAFIYVGMGGVTFLFFIFLQMFFNASAITTGLVMLVFSAGMIPFSLFTPRFGGNFSPRAICMLGIIISAVACMLLGFGITALHGIGIIFYIALFILGVGTGIVASQANFIVAASIKDKKLAAESSGLQGAMRNIGQALSLSIVGVIFISILTVTLHYKVDKSTKINSISKQRIEKEKVIYAYNTKTLLKLIHSKYKNISPEGEKAANTIMRNSSIFAFKLTNIIMGFLLLLFLLLAKDLSSEKLKLIQKHDN